MRNDDAQGALLERPTAGEFVQLVTYPLWLLHRPPFYLRIATGESAGGLVLWPTAAEQTRAADERARSADQQVRASLDLAQQEATRARQAEDELLLLREELARLRGEKP